MAGTKGPLDGGIEHGGDVPDQADVRLTAVTIPYRSSDVPPGRTTRRISATARAASGMNCSTSIEKARSKELSSNGRTRASADWKLIRGSVLRARANSTKGPVKSIPVTLATLAISGQRECQAAGPAADIQNAVAIRKATKSDQQRCKAAAPPSHDLLIGFSVLEAGRCGGVGIGHR